MFKSLLTSNEGEEISPESVESGREQQRFIEGIRE